MLGVHIAPNDAHKELNGLDEVYDAAVEFWKTKVWLTYIPKGPAHLTRVDKIHVNRAYQVQRFSPVLGNLVFI